MLGSEVYGQLLRQLAPDRNCWCPTQDYVCSRAVQKLGVESVQSTPVISEFRDLRQKDNKFEAMLYRFRFVLEETDK